MTVRDLTVGTDNEREELAQLERLLAELSEELATAEADRAEGLADFARFRAEMERRILPLFAELDRIETAIAQLLATWDRPTAPTTPPAQTRSAGAGSPAASAPTGAGEPTAESWSSAWARGFAERSRARRAEEAAADAATMTGTDEDQANLREAYRAAAKRVHPDTADTDEERDRRTFVMAAINEAYERGDAEAIERILDGEAIRPGPVSDDDVRRRITITERKIAQVRVRLKQLKGWRLAQMSVPYWLRYQISCDQREAGRDHLADLEADTRARIAVSETWLVALRVARQSGATSVPPALREAPPPPDEGPNGPALAVGRTRLWACPVHHEVHRRLMRQGPGVRVCPRPGCFEFDESLLGW